MHLENIYMKKKIQRTNNAINKRILNITIVPPVLNIKTRPHSV